MKTLLLLPVFLLACLCPAAQQGPQYGPAIRYVGKSLVDLTPLMDWLKLPPDLQARQPRPLRDWGTLPQGSSTFTTNGWTWFIERWGGANYATTWFAVRNSPANVRPGGKLALNLKTTISTRWSGVIISGPAYDYGASKPTP